jgi:DNA-binding GntR family transcriptional regulator
LESNRKIGRDVREREKIVRGNLSDEVVKILRDMIIQDELRPGSRIPEIELCSQLNISRTPLREAIRVLASEGLVTSSPRRGAIVAIPTRDEIQGLFFAIGAIEAACAELACADWTDSEITSFMKLQSKLSQYGADDHNPKAYFEANLAIHQAIVRGARNNFLSDLHHSLSTRISRARFFIEVPRAARLRALTEHEQIANFVQKRDARSLSELLRKHMQGAWRDYEVTLDRPQRARLRPVR